MTELNATIHVQGRLRIMTVLSTLGEGDALSFPKLQSILETTSGNLATHLKKLEDHGYIRISKVIESRTPITYIQLNDEGRQAFREYKQALRRLLDESL
ncbi:MAG: transcriptional regulator [Microbacteriaceae bacterium]